MHVANVNKQTHTKKRGLISHGNIRQHIELQHNLSRLISEALLSLRRLYF